MVRPTYVEIDLSAIAQNVRAFQALIAPSVVCAVVKADAYGHGDVPVAHAALQAGARSLAVALVEEGVRLREAGVEAPILVLSEPDVTAVEDLARWNLTPTVYSADFIEALAASDLQFDVQINVDTGMHRVGAEPEHLAALMEAVDRHRSLDLAAVWTHFAVADSDPDFTRHQIEVFDEALDGRDVPFQHLCNTPGAVLFPEARRHMCRIGLGLYGLHPSTETVRQLDLRPAMKFVSQVTHVQRRSKGDRPSYGRVRELERDSTVVTVPVGYADGFVRELSNQGSALIGGQVFPVAGTVTMDQIVIDVGDEDVAIGDEVVLLGSQGEASITADDWADLLGTISYEVVSSIGPRVPRRYV